MEMILGASKILIDVTPSEMSVIKDELSLPNPAYQSALKYTAYNRVAIPKYLFYYEQLSSTIISVPRGYNPPFEYEVTDNHQFTCEDVSYPKFKIRLRETQIEAERAYIEQREQGNGVIVLPTGKGKSILGLHIAGVLKQRVLVIVHKDDLIDGWKKDAKVLYGLRPKQVGLIKAQTYRLGKQITLATIQTLGKLNSEQLKQLHEYFGMIIVDEFHHSAAKIYQIVNSFPAKDRLGLTATDMRNDGLEKVLNFYFGNECYRFKEVEDDEDIIAPRDVFVKVKESDIYHNPPDEYVYPNSSHTVSFVKLGEQVYHIDSLDRGTLESLVRQGAIKKKPLNYHEVRAKIADSIPFNSMIARDVLNEYKQKKSCLVFCLEKDHIRLIRDILMTQGVPEKDILLYYGDAKEDKATMKAKAESRECLITLATYAIATEGTNVKSWERIFLAMTFNNEKDAIQAIGRGRRKKEGKTTLIVYDYRHPQVKGTKRHGETRDKVYRDLGFKIEYPINSRVQKGWGFSK